MSELSCNACCERPKVAEHYCITSLKEASTSMQWAISDFDLLRMDASQCLESCSFESVSEGVHTGTWKMKLVPSYSKTESIGLYFTYSGNMENTYAEFEACLIDEDGKETNKMEVSCELALNDHGFDDFIQKDKIPDSLLPDGFLTIRADITVIRMNSTQTKSGQLNAGNSLSRDFSKLMKEEILKDAVLICGDREFPVHKCILSARSSVFSAMFTGDWKEKDSVEIKDMDADVLENLLSYIYTDNILDFTTVGMAIKLLEAANRYEVLELKGICENFLEKNISVQNLFEVVAAADLYSLDSVKAACITFMCEHGKEIALSNSFKEFPTAVPQYLLEEMLKRHFGGETTQKAKIFPTFVTQPASAITTQAMPTFGAPLVTQDMPTFGSSFVTPPKPTFGMPFVTQAALTFSTQAEPAFNMLSKPTFGTRATSTFTREVTSCPSCDPSLHCCTKTTSFKIQPDQQNALPKSKCPAIDFGKISK